MKKIILILILAVGVIQGLIAQVIPDSIKFRNDSIINILSALSVDENDWDIIKGNDILIQPGYLK